MKAAIRSCDLPGEWRWTGDLAARAAESGLLADPHRYELIDGRLIEKMPQSDLHKSLVSFFAQALGVAFGEGYFVDQNAPIRGGEHEEPEPDVCVVRGTPLAFLGRKATPSDIELVVEISQASRAYDLGDKRELYARIGIKEYWVVDLIDERIEIFTHPQEDIYKSHVTLCGADPCPRVHVKLAEVLAQARAVQGG